MLDRADMNERMLPLLRYGFRPFFLGAGLTAAVMLLSPRIDGKPG